MRAFVKDLPKILLVLVIAIVTIALVRTCEASRPDPFIRMTSPSGCSGGVIHASREHGIWIATCRHCVARPGRTVTVYFFWNGHRSPAVRGTCYRAHPRYDCSVVVVPPGELPVLPTVTELAGSEIGPRPGQTVYSIGSYAGGTYQPAVQKMAVTLLRSNGYEFTLNDTAWGGHSGGPVLDAGTNKLLGVLWGAGRNYSVVTANKAIWEVLLGRSLEPQSKDPGQEFSRSPMR